MADAEGSGGSRGRGPRYFLLMTIIVIGLILAALHVLHRIGNAIP